MKSLRCLPLTLALLAASAAQAAPVFSENFQSGLSNTIWTTNASGSIAADPKDAANAVLKFGTVRGGGDIWSLPVGAAGTYTISFDVLGTCASGDCGAFLGINDGVNFQNEYWLFGDTSFSTPNPTRSTGAWQHISITFTTASAFRVKMEDYNSRDNVAGDVYFDNICVANDGSCAAPAANGVPEPGSLALAGLALAGLGLARRRRG